MGAAGGSAPHCSGSGCRSLEQPPGRSLRVTLPWGGPSHLPELCHGSTPALATPQEGVGYLWLERRRVRCTGVQEP